MFDESLPSTPVQPVVALAPLDPEWQPVFHAPNQVVLYNPKSHALSVTKSSVSPHLAGTSPCPCCHRPLPRGFVAHAFSEGTQFHGSHSRTSNYFQLLAAANQISSRSSSPPLPSGSESHHEAFPRETMAEGYFQAFFQEEYRLGMGANGSVYLCQHVLDGQPLGHFAVKKIAVGESHSYLLNILREVRLLESLHHRNIITYHHAWLESYQFSAFGPKVPTLHVLMQWAEGGSLDDFIALRLGRSSKLPHMRSPPNSPVPDEPTPSARIRAFRAMKRAPPEERERLRREMEERTDSHGKRRSLKAVHLLSAEEVRSLFGDVAQGLAFLHDRSILHLDLKPGNVLLTWDEGSLVPRAMLSDFGTSRDMIQSSGPRSGNTGTLEYASPESLPAPLTGALRQIDSKSDMWSLGMILHKMLFFRLPYRYATEGEASVNDEADKMDKLEQEILCYPGFRSTSAHVTSFESRHLPSSFLMLLEGLLSVTPSARPSSERIVNAMRKGRFDPVVPSTPASSSSLIQVRRKPDESNAVQDGHFLSDVSLSPTEKVERDDATGKSDKKSSMFRLFPLLSNRQLGAVDTFVERFTRPRWGPPRVAWVSSLKAWILAVKALSIVSMWPSRPVLVAIVGFLAILDTMLEGLGVSLVLGLLHLVIIRGC